MVVLRIEHPVPDFGSWKKAFDSDPIGRERSGVRRYRILRSIDESNEVMVDLELDRLEQAEDLLVSLQKLWGRVQGTVMTGPRARIVEIVETKEYGIAAE